MKKKLNQIKDNKKIAEWFNKEILKDFKYQN